MPLLKEAEEEVKLEFKWGKKRAGTNKHAQFYESFTYDGVEYSLYDCVYVWRTNQPEPDIGTIVEIWESPSYEKKVKLVWFFRPNEISMFLGEYKPLKNEIFLASGEGQGLFNLNPLEEILVTTPKDYIAITYELAICGKCNVVCTSKNKRNLQASDAKLRMADFIFYRTFDVGNRMLSNNFPDRIADIKVECFFNKNRVQTLFPPKFKPNLNERAENVSSFSKDKKMGNTVRDWKSSDVASTDIQTSKKRKLLGDSGESLVELSSKFSAASKPGEGRSTKIMRISEIGFKDDLMKLSDPLPRLPDCKEEACDVKILSSQNRGIPKGATIPEKTSKISDKSSSLLAKDKGIKPDNQVIEVTRRPNAQETKSWFTQLPWEERMKRAHEKGTLVFLENLDPSYTSSEVQDIVWHALNEMVDAKMIEQTTFSSPLNGTAFVIFKTKVAAGTAILELTRRCLMLPNGRPLLAYIRTPTESDKATKFVGHLELDKARSRQRKEMRDAVATSHFSQSNTIEYHMALEWCILHEKADAWRNALHEKQALEIKELRSQLKYS